MAGAFLRALLRSQGCAPAHPLKPHKGIVGHRRVLPEHLQREHGCATNLTAEPSLWTGRESVPVTVSPSLGGCLE